MVSYLTNNKLDKSNKTCPDFFVKSEDGSVLTQWWNSNGASAQYLDFSNKEAREWFVERLKLLQEKHGIDSFKFDAGECTFAPTVLQFT